MTAHVTFVGFFKKKKDKDDRFFEMTLAIIPRGESFETEKTFDKRASCFPISSIWGLSHGTFSVFGSC